MDQPHEHMADSEEEMQRNPHPDFKKVEATRPDWNDLKFHITKTKQPHWKPGSGSNDAGKSIDPYDDGRPARFNYKLLTSAIVPRPIGLLSIVCKDGNSNLAPFSFFNMINHDPPLFIVGFVGGYSQAKDSLANLSETKEACINIISDHYLEAAHACSVNAPRGFSEWAVAGLHASLCTDIKPSRVQEAVFAVEAKLFETKEFESRVTPGKNTGVMAILEGVKFWARDDAINEDRNLIDPEVLRPVSRMGGITYGRIVTGVELPRPDWNKDGYDESIL